MFLQCLEKTGMICGLLYNWKAMDSMLTVGTITWPIEPAEICLKYYLLFTGDQEDTGDKPFTMNSPVLGSRGWRMAVHEPNTLPAMFDEGFDILPGMSTSISLTSTET